MAFKIIWELVLLKKISFNSDSKYFKGLNKLICKINKLEYNYIYSKIVQTDNKQYFLLTAYRK